MQRPATESTRKWKVRSASERRPQIDEELERRQLGDRCLTRRGRSCRACSALNDKPRGVEQITQIDGHWPDRSAIAKFKSHRLRKIVELIRAIRQAYIHGTIECIDGGPKCGHRRRGPQRNFSDTRKYVSRIVEHRSAQWIPDEGQVHRETQILIKNQQSLSTDGKSGYGIARSRLIEREASQGRAAAGEESFGKRNLAGNSAAVGSLHSETSGTRKHQSPAGRTVGGILYKYSKEIN